MSAMLDRLVGRERLIDIAANEQAMDIPTRWEMPVPEPVHHEPAMEPSEQD